MSSAITILRLRRDDGSERIVRRSGDTFLFYTAQAAGDSGHAIEYLDRDDGPAIIRGRIREPDPATPVVFANDNSRGSLLLGEDAARAVGVAQASGKAFRADAIGFYVRGRRAAVIQAVLNDGTVCRSELLPEDLARAMASSGAYGAATVITEGNLAATGQGKIESHPMISHLPHLGTRPARGIRWVELPEPGNDYGAPSPIDDGKIRLAIAGADSVSGGEPDPDHFHRATPVLGLAFSR